ncbi:hypothetical protein [Bartonella rattimassiliensis]|uniref:FecR protein domain-containing protein n=1 Tax=Bartonella rattimassiliensis 15908 TaxID=1094556 RepID=J0QPR7_9HYPH|nr:hypothetical protein [Bartonella rattimassiliensis]EJF85004.1 hypothetical protein MCY_01387 [Bartonella rattimassiliensis 15908]
MLKYSYALMIVILLNNFTITAFAAIVKNTDLKVQSITVVEGSIPSKISLNTHQTIKICMKGCFITFPNKDRFAIKADDNIEIKRGRVIFK